MKERDCWNNLFGKFYDCDWTIVPIYGAKWMQNPHTRVEYLTKERYCD